MGERAGGRADGSHQHLASGSGRRKRPDGLHAQRERRNRNRAKAKRRRRLSVRWSRVSHCHTPVTTLLGSPSKHVQFSYPRAGGGLLGRCHVSPSPSYISSPPLQRGVIARRHAALTWCTSLCEMRAAASAPSVRRTPWSAMNARACLSTHGAKRSSTSHVAPHHHERPIAGVQCIHAR